MKALSILYGGRLAAEALSCANGESAVSMALTAASQFFGVQKSVFLGVDGQSYELPPNVEIVCRPTWTKKDLFRELSRLGSGFDLVYVAWADCPLLDPELAKSMAERHLRYAAEYTYADGLPYGFAPEILAPATAGILAKMIDAQTFADDPSVDRDAIFSVIQKDINSFDIETEISTVDLRHYRLSFSADSKRNAMLLSRFSNAGCKSASDAETFITQHPEMMRTLPAFFSIQVSAVCPQSCSYCPWTKYAPSSGTNKLDNFMAKATFEKLLDNIQEFSGDAVIDLSLWGELSLHPQKMELIEMVLDRPALSLLIETSGIGWTSEQLKELALMARKSAPRKNHHAPLSWIISLDAHDPQRYKELRGPGFAEAQACAKNLLELFPCDTYVQAVRMKGFEDDIEHFYRTWKDSNVPDAAIKAGRKDGRHIIIQKYNDFAGALPKMQASDLSPVKRRQCWHIQRDMNILLDGTVPSCKEDLSALSGKADRPVLGNAFTDDLSLIWERGNALYMEHCNRQYKGICAQCDEYYTYNF